MPGSQLWRLPSHSAALCSRSNHGGRRRDRPPVLVEHPVLAASLARLYAGSPRWREAIDAIANTGRRVIVLTPEKVRVRDDARGSETPFDPDVIAEVQPIADDWSRVDTVVVVINLPLLDTPL